MKTYYIYKLIDPITNNIRYIGKTTNLQKRYYSHCSLAYNNKEKTHRANWIKSLLKQDLKPVLNLVEECQNWQEREIYWIKYYKEQGFDLCNLTLGGDGGLGLNRYKEFPVYQFDRKGNLLNIFKSTRDAFEKTGVRLSYISKCLIGEYILGGGFHWSKDKNFKLKNRNHNAKYVLQLDLEGNFIKEFNSLTEASMITKIQRNSIKNCCLNKPHAISAGGYKWKYK